VACSNEAGFYQKLGFVVRRGFVLLWFFGSVVRFQGG
jgi:hypothetical protein